MPEGRLKVSDERCTLCGTDLSVRSVKRHVRRGVHLPPGPDFEKRVSMRPAQIVFHLSIEGSLGRDKLPPVALEYFRDVRLCSGCVKSCRSGAEVVAVAMVALDKAMEEGK